MVTFTVISPVLLIMPARTVSFTLIDLGTGSPVKGNVSTKEEPSITSPSRGIFSPGLIIISSSGLTSSGETVLISPLLFRFA